MIATYLFFKVVAILTVACFWIFVYTAWVMWLAVVALFTVGWWVIKGLIAVIALIVRSVRGRRAAIA